MKNLKTTAQELAGNWIDFDSFWWNDKPDDADNWGIVYTSNRDSDLLTLSNECEINKVLKQKKYANDIRFESHSHWAVGHVDGFSIRCLAYGEPTPAFSAYHKLVKRLEEYPILNEEDFSEREHNDTIENIGRVLKDFADPNGNSIDIDPYDCYTWFCENDYGRAIDPCDGGGGYPSVEEMENCLRGLNIKAKYIYE